MHDWTADTRTDCKRAGEFPGPERVVDDFRRWLAFGEREVAVR